MDIAFVNNLVSFMHELGFTCCINTTRRSYIDKYETQATSVKNLAHFAQRKSYSKGKLFILCLTMDGCILVLCSSMHDCFP